MAQSSVPITVRIRAEWAGCTYAEATLREAARFGPCGQGSAACRLPVPEGRTMICDLCERHTAFSSLRTLTIHDGRRGRSVTVCPTCRDHLAPSIVKRLADRRRDYYRAHAREIPCFVVTPAQRAEIVEELSRANAGAYRIVSGRELELFGIPVVSNTPTVPE